MECDPLVSISCITYNHVLFLRQCLDAILQQECAFTFEVLIHDDASDDGTAEIIKEYALKFPDIIKPIIQEKNLYSQGVRGISPQYNISRARGKYIAMCEGDDYWISIHKLREQVAFLELNEAFAGAYHETEVIYADSKRAAHPFRMGMPDTLSVVDTISFRAPFHTSSFIFRKSAFEQPSWLYKVDSVDMAMFSIVASKGNLKKIPDLLSVYRRHKKGISNTAPHTTQYNSKRIMLLNYLNEYHQYFFNRKVKYVIALHKLYSTFYPFVRQAVIFRNRK